MIARFRSVSIVFLAAALLATVVPAQEYRSTLSGRVLDAQQAAVPGAKILLIAVETGARYETVSDAEGAYVIPFLPPGPYNVTAEAQGFKRYVRERVQMVTNERRSLDINLELGQLAETVTVTAETSLLETQSASTGQVITARQIENMPMNGRTPLVLAQLAFGVTPAADPRFARPFDNAGPSGFSMGGAPAQSNELLLDGAPDTTRNMRVAYNPPVDGVAEVKVETFMADAAYGHTAGGTVNVVMRGGTNEFHGSLYNFNQVSKLAATPFFTNRAGQKKSVTRYNQYGVNAAGPLVIPKLFDGRNKVFWRIDYEGIKDSYPEPITTSVPTDAFRNGNFASLLSISANYTIYDPNTGVVEGARIRRTPFPGNTIPSNRINAIARNYFPFWPSPNQPGQADGRDNYLAPSVRSDDFNSQIGRLDFNLSDRHKFFYNFRHNERLENRGNRFFNVATGNFLKRVNWGTMVDDVYTFSPTTLLNTRLNWTRFTEGNVRSSNGFDLTSLGFPQSLRGFVTKAVMPRIEPGAINALGDSGGDDTPFDIFQIFVNLTKIRGKHSLKIGTDLRLQRESSNGFGNSSGLYQFGTQWTRGPLDNSTGAPFGQEFASFLLGLPTGGNWQINASRTGQYGSYAFFLQDDWRVRNNLTLNLGIRYDHDTPVTERFNRTTVGFDPNVASPVDAAARAAYARSPIPELPIANFKAVGGMLFAGPGSRSVYDTNGYFSPRFGFAWQPGFVKRTSVRGGIGVFMGPLDPSIQQPGFSQTTNIVPTLNSFLSPNATLSDPFPAPGIQQPSGSSLGIATFLGQGITIVDRDRSNPYSVRWTIDVQRELGRNLVFEIGYVGNHAVHLRLPNSDALRYVPPQFLSTSPFRDQPVINNLSAVVANPFAGLLPGTTLNANTFAKSNLLVDFPHFTGVSLSDRSAGNSYFHMLQTRLEKRYSSGLQFLANYQWSRLIERRTRLNAFSDLHKRIAAEDRPHRFVFSSSYDLPFGKGKPYGAAAHPVVRHIIGGWILNGIYTYQPGPPAGDWGNVIYLGGDLNWDPRNIDNTFNRDPFITKTATVTTWSASAASASALASNIRTFPQRFTNLRNDGVNNVDASILKNFDIRETVRLQFRTEFFNFFNHVTFNGPNLDPTNSNFARITGQANLPRTTQMALKLTW
jgi:hypothetical protein